MKAPAGVVVALLALMALLGPGAAAAATLHPKLVVKSGYGAELPSSARTANGTLHVVYETNKNWGNSANGIGAVSISPSGTLGPAVQALAWGTGPSNGIPGLAVMPGGTLEAVFGGSPGGDQGPWGISSTNGGATWSAPTDVGSGTMEGGGAMKLQVSGGSPVLTEGCCGTIVIQHGLGLGAPTNQIVNSTDGAAGNVASALDAATGAVVDSWDSVDGSGGLWLQQVAPTLGPAVKAAVPSQYGTGAPLPVAGRDTGAGVYAAYPANYAARTSIRLLRYGGGTVAVGSVKGVHANAWGVATGPDGRIWVMWAGQLSNGKGVVAVTRSNKAVTRFEPIQRFQFLWSGLVTLSGDGRLGPLDMLMSGTPWTKTCCGTTGIYYARFPAELSDHVSVKHLGGKKFQLTVKVTDAGDAVSGASVSVKGTTVKTGPTGVAQLTVTGKAGKHVKVTVLDSGYLEKTSRVKL